MFFPPSHLIIPKAATAMRRTNMALDIWKNKGVDLNRQHEFTWKNMVQNPISKLDDDAYTRIRVILMNGIEFQSLMFKHNLARMNKDLRDVLAHMRRIEHHQQVTVNWLLPPDQSPLETTIGYEQVAIEVTASVAQNEPDPYMAQVYRFGLLEDFDHLYRYSALMDRMTGMDPNVILQCYSDILPGRPTSQEHRDPSDDLRRPYEKEKADPLTKLNAMTIMSGEQQTLNYYLNIGPTFTDPIARQLYAEISSIEEQHVTQYESIIDPSETWMEKLLLQEATEVYNYWCCYEQEDNPRLKGIWEQFLDYELGHLHLASDLFKKYEGRDPLEILPKELPEPIHYSSQRDFVRETLKAEVNLRADGADFVGRDQEPERSLKYRQEMNSEGSPSDSVAEGYVWEPGTELARANPEKFEHRIHQEGARL